MLRHLRDVTLFNLRHGTDTDKWLPLEAYAERPESFAEAVQYQPSWTREVMRAIGTTATHVDLASAAFVDFGRGKCKVRFIAERFPFREVHGVEFYRPLRDILAPTSAGSACAHASTAPMRRPGSPPPCGRPRPQPVLGGDLASGPGSAVGGRHLHEPDP